jgi:glycosyltransferase involved in cell wall biosynthesis
VKWDLDLLDGYTSQFMGKAASRRRIGGFFSMIAPQLWSAIRGKGFDAVVIHGHNLAAHHLALVAAKSSNTPVFARAETHLGLSRSAWRQTMRTPLLKAWYRAFDGFLAIGTRNRQYYEAMGVPASKLFSMPYAIDNDRFLRATQLTSGKRDAIRSKLGVDDDAPAIIYAAKFDRRKRPADLIEAFHKLQQSGLTAHLVMVGSGRLDGQLKAMVAARNTQNIVFPGFVNQAELPEIYAACDVFVLPSENEPWGLAVNEAMCAGLPIVLSEEIGCAADLVESGVNGATFKAGDVDALTDALGAILTNPDHRAQCSEASVARIPQWSFAQCAEGLRSAIDATRSRI